MRERKPGYGRGSSSMAASVHSIGHHICPPSWWAFFWHVKQTTTNTCIAHEFGVFSVVGRLVLYELKWDRQEPPTGTRATLPPPHKFRHLGKPMYLYPSWKHGRTLESPPGSRHKRLMPDIKITSEGLFIDGTTSVGAWEAPIQQLLAQSIVTKGSTVLEIGYGLGMASRAITELCPAAHWLLERYPALLPPAAHDQNPMLTGIVIAPWETALPLFGDGSFEVLLFDADPPTPAAYDGSVAATFSFIAPVLPEAARILRSGGRVGFIDFSTLITTYSPFQRLAHSLAFDVAAISVPTDAPANCRYAPNPKTHIVRLTKTSP